jgi:1-acyl-sn-glycerol-3-phosphate acyltransferase
VIIAVNHLSAVDSFLVPLLVPRRVVFLAKAEYFTGTGLKNRSIAWWFRALGAIPVQRGRGRAARESLDTAARVLADGGAFGIHPEGTRSRDGRLHRGKIGVARLALECGVPVVPVALTGTDKLLPVGATLLRPRRFTAVFGAALDFSRYAGTHDSPPILRAVTDEIMYAIMELSQQEYIDSYEKSPMAA